MMSKEEEKNEKEEEETNILGQKKQRGRPRKTRSWCSKSFLKAFTNVDTEALLEEGYEYSRKRRVFELFVSPGRVVAKVQDDLSKPTRVEIIFRQLTEGEWDKAFTSLAKDAFFYANLLAEKLPSEVESYFEKAGVSLFPNSSEDIEIIHEGHKGVPLTKHVAAVLYRLCEKLDSEPFTILILRGRGVQESIQEIKKLRTTLMPQIEQTTSVGYHHVQYESAPPLAEMFSSFWTSGPKLGKLSYSIKADELPAALLKWLDPMPLSGIEDEVDFIFEDAYVQVATRAQAFGLGL